MKALLAAIMILCLMGCGGVYHNPNRTQAQTRQDFSNANLEAKKYSQGNPFQEIDIKDAYLRAQGYEVISKKEAKRRGWTLQKH